MHGSKTVLHVDDDPAFLSLATTVFDRDPRFEMVSAASGAEGLDRLAGQSFDCVVSDSIRLPDGEPFVARVRREHPDLPVVLFTAKDQESVADDLGEETVTSYVRKAGTEDFETLLTRLSSVTEATADRLAVTNEVGGQSDTLPSTDDLVLTSLDLGDAWTVSGIDDWGDGGTITESVTDTAAAVTGVDSKDLPPLFDSIDPEALAATVGSSPGGRDRRGVQVRFPYAGLEFAVSADGVLAYRDPSESED